MTAVVTSVLTGATTGLLAAVISKHSLAAVVAGCVAAVGAMAAMMRYQYAAWERSIASNETVHTQPAPAADTVGD